MNSTLLKAHKDLYASATIQSRAKNIKVIAINEEKKKRIFTYKGSASVPYKITFTQKDGNIQSHCTCPYDWGGWCKHQVAAANYMIAENSSKTHQKAIHKPQNNGEIFLTDHLISDRQHDLLTTSQRVSFYSYYDSDIHEVDTNKITTYFNDWQQDKQTFVYNPKTNILKITCTCKNSKEYYCNHIGTAVNTIIETYGNRVFSP